MIAWNRIVLWVAPALLLGLPIVSSFAQDGGPEDVRKKLEAIRKQINDLREKENALLKREMEIQRMKAELEREARLKEAERKRKELEERVKQELAEKAKHYIKVEIRGKLARGNSLSALPVWYLSINEVAWALSFQGAKGPDKALLEEGEKLIGKHVVVTGSISTKLTPIWYGGIGNTPLIPWDVYPLPRNWNPPTRNWNPYPGPMTMNPTVIVESINLAK